MRTSKGGAHPDRNARYIDPPKTARQTHPAMLQVFGGINRGHAALAQLALEAVAVGEGGGQAARYVSHDQGRGADSGVNSSGCAVAARFRISATSCVMPVVSAR